MFQGTGAKDVKHEEDLGSCGWTKQLDIDSHNTYVCVFKYIDIYVSINLKLDVGATRSIQIKNDSWFCSRINIDSYKPM